MSAAKLSVRFAPQYFNNSLTGGGSSQLNAILSNYNINAFYQEVPDAAKLNHPLVPRLLRYYVIEVDDSQLNDLYAELLGVQLIENIDLIEDSGVTNCPETEPCTTDDPQSLWTLSHHDLMNVREAWCITTGDPDIVVALFDRGYNNTGSPANNINDFDFHMDIDPNSVIFLDPDLFGNPHNDQCHGLASAGAVGAIHNNNFGLTGSGGNVSMMFYHSSGLANKLCDATARGANVITASICYGSTQARRDALQCITDLGVTFVMAAGNGPTSNVHNCGLAQDNNAVSVSGSTRTGCFQTTWNCFVPQNPLNTPLFHSHNNAVDFIGQSLCTASLDCNDGVGASVGTSIAAPAVAGVIALVKSVNPCLNTHDIIDLMESSATSPMDIDGYNPNFCQNESFYGNNPDNVPGIPNAHQAVCDAENWCGAAVTLSDAIIAQNTGCNGCLGDRLISGDLIVESGTTLTINGQFSFAECSRLIVRQNATLIIDGGILTSCGTEWKGIIVEGDTGAADNENSNAGRVYLQNGAIIENARTAISMNPSHLPWTNQMWGGFVSGANSTIRNCRRAIEFMRHGQGGVQDQSRFVRMNFIDLSHNGTTSWANDGVSYNNCYFGNIGTSGAVSNFPINSGILLHSSAATVNNISTFFNIEIGIDILYPDGFGFFGSNINGNDFRVSKTGVFVSSAAPIQDIEIEDNLFRGGEQGVFVDGMSKVNIRSNTFHDHNESVLMCDSGSIDQNEITDNEFQQANQGNKFEFNNGGALFLTNCYSLISEEDVLIIGAGGIVFSQQGDNFQAAGNCFSKTGIGMPEINNVANGNLDYFIGPDAFSDPSLCQGLQHSTNVNDEPALTEPLLDCGYPGTFFDDDDDDCEKLEYIRPSELLNLISKADQEILNLQSQPDYNVLNKTELLKNELISSLPLSIQIHGEQEQYNIDFLAEYLSNRPEFFARTYAVNFLYNEGMKIEAKSLLNQIEVTTQEEENYIEVLNYYYDYLEGGEEEVSATILNRVRQIGLTAGAKNGIARSFYYLLTGERLRLIAESDEEVDPRSDTKALERSIKNYPNPVQNESLFIEISEPKSNLYYFEIIDYTGKIIVSREIESNQRLSQSTRTMSSGLYFLTIYDNEGLNIYTDKITVLK